jgi:hypothetical protein
MLLLSKAIATRNMPGNQGRQPQNEGRLNTVNLLPGDEGVNKTGRLGKSRQWVAAGTKNGSILPSPPDSHKMVINLRCSLPIKINMNALTRGVSRAYCSASSLIQGF